MRATTLCIAASVLLCLVASPVAARQLRQETNTVVPNETAAEVSPSPPVTTEPTLSPPTTNVVVVNDTAAGSNTATDAGTAGGITANNYTAAFPSIMDAVTAANTTAAGNMSILMSAIEASGVAKTITNDTAWTILAPNNAAFEKTLAALNLTAQELLANQSLLSTILSYHVIPAAAINSSSLTPGASVATALPGANLTVDITNLTGTPNVTFIGDSNNASVLVPDIIAGNSTIHVIDSVLLPPANATLPAAGGNATTGTTPDMTVVVLNGTANETSPPPTETTSTMSPPPTETTTASPPPVDTTTTTASPPVDTTATNTGTAGTTDAANTDTAMVPDATGAAGTTPTGNAATDATGGTAAGNTATAP